MDLSEITDCVKDILVSEKVVKLSLVNIKLLQSHAHKLLALGEGEKSSIKGLEFISCRIWSQEQGFTADYIPQGLRDQIEKISYSSCDLRDNQIEEVLKHLTDIQTLKSFHLIYNSFTQDSYDKIGAVFKDAKNLEQFEFTDTEYLDNGYRFDFDIKYCKELKIKLI